MWGDIEVLERENPSQVRIVSPVEEVDYMATRYSHHREGYFETSFMVPLSGGKQMVFVQEWQQGQWVNGEWQRGTWNTLAWDILPPGKYAYERGELYAFEPLDVEVCLINRDGSAWEGEATVWASDDEREIAALSLVGDTDISPTTCGSFEVRFRPVGNIAVSANSPISYGWKIVNDGSATLVMTGAVSSTQDVQWNSLHLPMVTR